MEGRMWPIRTEVKSKRLRHGKPQSFLTWAWQKELRENAQDRRIYREINPYMEVYRFRDNLYGIWADNLDGMGDVWMFLIVGPRKAMLIDTAYGLGNYQGLLDELTDGKEVIVVTTHEHYDHAYGNCRFDRVYCHEYLVPYLKSQHEHMWDYIFDPFGEFIWVEFDKKDLPRFKPYEIIGVPDGYVWDLGDGYEVELILTGGHSIGHAAYLDKRNRILFPGDNICSDFNTSCGTVDMVKKEPHGEVGTLQFFRDATARLVERMGEYDYIFPQHHMVNIEGRFMEDVLKTCDAILKDPDDYDYKQVTYGKFRMERTIRYYKHIYGGMPISYTMARDNAGIQYQQRVNEE